MPHLTDTNNWDQKVFYSSLFLGGKPIFLPLPCSLVWCSKMWLRCWAWALLQPPWCAWVHGLFCWLSQFPARAVSRDKSFPLGHTKGRCQKD